MVVRSSFVAVLVLSATFVLNVPASIMAASTDEAAAQRGELNSNGSAVKSNGQSEAAEHTAPWQVVQVVGGVHLRSVEQTAGAWDRVTPGLALANGAELKTGSDGRLTVSNGHDTINVSPDSHLVIP